MTVITLNGTEKVNFIREAIAKTEGRWFSLDNIKRTTGEARHWSAVRIGVAKYVTGVGLSYNPKQYNLQGVWEPAAGTGADAYRMLDLTTIKRLKVDGTEYTFE